jgi:hypothetical protein
VTSKYMPGGIEFLEPGKIGPSKKDRIKILEAS